MTGFNRMFQTPPHSVEQYEVWLKEVEDRLSRHQSDCERCRRRAANSDRRVCGVAVQIETQREAVLRGLEATKGDGSRAG